MTAYQESGSLEINTVTSIGKKFQKAKNVATRVGTLQSYSSNCPI